MDTDFVRARRKKRELKVSSGVGGRDEPQISGRTVRDDTRIADGLPLAPFASNHIPAYEAPVANRLQTPKRFDLLACLGDGQAIVREIIEYYGLVRLLSQVKQPAIPNGQLWQARSLRGIDNHGSRRGSVENLLGVQLKSFFVFIRGGHGGNGTHKNVGVPIGIAAAIPPGANEASVQALDRLVSDLPDGDYRRFGDSEA